jgi:hypothetical protein
MRTITKLGLVILMTALPAGVKASQPSAESNHEQTWTGTLTAVNTQNESLTGGHWWYHETFNVGKHCAISTVDKAHAGLADLRPGEEARIRYREAEGVRVADHVSERPLHYTGTVQAVNAKQRMVTMAEAALYKPFHAPMTFRVASDCKVTLPSGKSANLTDLQPGDRIAVIYELPGGSPVAYRIRNKCSTFVGTVAAINLPERTIEAKGNAGARKFDLGDDCQIMLGSKQNGHLKDVAMHQTYEFTYQRVNGINVLDRLSPVQATKVSETASTM